MTGFESRRIIFFFWGFLASNFVVAQESSVPALSLPKTNQSLPTSKGVEHWLEELTESEVDRQAGLAVHQLSQFHLSRGQVDTLIAAAEKADSDPQRLRLWQAIRNSQDSQGRKYLISTLLQSSAGVQVHFLEEFRNPSQFDLPILAALYNQPERGVPAFESNPPGDPVPSEERTSGAGPVALPALKKQAAVEESGDDIFDDTFDVRQKIVELVTLTDWDSSLIDNGPSPPSSPDNRSEEAMRKHSARSRKTSQDAAIAQKEMVHWLIRNGRLDEHRVAAFHRYVFFEKDALKNNLFVDYGYEFVNSLSDPASKAQAVKQFYAWANPGRFLGTQEPEIVRLSAIEAMEHRIIESRKSNASIKAMTLLQFEPLLSIIQQTDPSPKVQAAAQRLEATIAEYKKQDQRLVK